MLIDHTFDIRVNPFTKNILNVTILTLKGNSNTDVNIFHTITDLII